MVIVAVKVTVAPLQAVLPGLADIEMVGVTNGVTVIVIPALVTVAGPAQAALVLISHVITSPLARLLLVNVVALPPLAILFTFHW